MADEVYVELPDFLVAEVEDDGVEEVERFRAGDLAQVVDVVVGVAAFGGNLATIVVGVDAVRGFARKLCRALLRRSSPAEPTVQLSLSVRSHGVVKNVKVEITGSADGEPAKADVEFVRAALAAAFGDGK